MSKQLDLFHDSDLFPGLAIVPETFSDIGGQHASRETRTEVWPLATDLPFVSGKLSRLYSLVRSGKFHLRNSYDLDFLCRRVGLIPKVSRGECQRRGVVYTHSARRREADHPEWTSSFRDLQRKLAYLNVNVQVGPNSNWREHIRVSLFIKSREL